MGDRTAAIRIPRSHFVVWALLFASLAVFCAAVYPSIPDSVAVHLGANGVDRLRVKTPFLMLGPLSIFAFCCALFTSMQAMFAYGLRENFLYADESPSDEFLRSHRAVQRWWFVSSAGFSAVVGFGLAWGFVSVRALELSCVGVVAGSVALSVGFLVPMIRHYSQFKRVWDAVSPADPKAWRGGVVYSNPADPRLFVPREYGGIGMTLNFAHRRAKWGMIAFTAAMAGFVAFCILVL